MAVSRDVIDADDICSDGCATLWRCRRPIAEDLRAEDVIAYLVEDGVLTRDDVEVIRHEVTTRAQTNKLIDIILMCGPTAVRSLKRGLVEVYPHLAIELQQKTVTREDRNAFDRWRLSNTITSNVRGKECDAASIALVAEELRHHYRQALRYLTPVPWNATFRVEMTSVLTTLKMVNAKRRRPQRRRFNTDDNCRRPVTFVSNSDDSGESITSDELFNLHAFRASPSRVLVEGEAGIGKTTLCQMIAYNWAKSCSPEEPQSSSSLRHRFDLVFLMDASFVAEKATIVDAIYATLLPEQFPVDRQQLTEWLAAPAHQERVLFVLDAYDELVASHREMAQLCRRRLYSRTSLLLTSRPTFADDVTRHFNSRYVIMGYPLERRKAFIERYAVEANLPHALFTRLDDILYDNDLLYDLSRNPLYFWFMCLLAEDDGGELPTTRTGLFEKVIGLIHRKTLISVSTKDPESQLRAIHRFAFDSIAEDDCCAEDKENIHTQSTKDIWLKYGLICRERSTSKLNPHLHYRFPHRTFREFFAARFLADKSAAERHRLLRRHRGVRWQIVIVFLAGLLKGDDRALCRLMREVVCRQDLSETTTVSALVAMPARRMRAIHATHHLGLQCIAECGAMFDGFESLRESLVPRCLAYAVATCHHCLRGFVAACNTDGAPKPTQLLVDGIDLDVYALRERGGLLEALGSLSAPPSLIYHGAENVNSAGDHVARMCRRTCLRHLHVHLATSALPLTQSIQYSDDAFIPLRRHLRTLAFGGSSSRLRSGAELLAHGQERLFVAIAAAMGPHLRRLALAEHTLTGWAAETVMGHFQRCTRLRALRLESVVIDVDIFRQLCEILLSIATLKELSLKSCTLSSIRLYEYLPVAFFKVILVNPLQDLILHGDYLCETNIPMLVQSLSSDDCVVHNLDISFASFNSRMWSSLCEWIRTKPRVQKLSLRKSFTVAADITYFTDAIPCMEQLSSLDVSDNDISSSSLLKKFCKSLASLSCLRELRMEYCRLTDEADDGIALLRDVIPQLTCLSLLGNALGTNAAGMIDISSLLSGTSRLETIHISAARLHPESAVVLATALSRNDRMHDVRIACHPNKRLTSKEGFRLVYANFKRRFSLLSNFRLGFSEDMTCPYESHEWQSPQYIVGSL